ncbi:hypothetical protein Hanom_Chr11g01004711 [Helianthus anomalus]
MYDIHLILFLFYVCYIRVHGTMVEEFLPPLLASNRFRTRRFCYCLQELRFSTLLLMIFCFKLAKHGGGSTKRGNFNHGNRTMNNRTNMAQREDVIRTTIRVSDIDQECQLI